MGWCLLRLSAKILAVLRLSVNFFSVTVNKKIDFFCFKEFNKPAFFVSSKQNKGLRSSIGSLLGPHCSSNLLIGGEG